MDSESPKVVLIELEPDEAIVLFEFLSRYCEQDALSIEGKSGQVALWNLLCLLEKQLVEPFLPEYNRLVQEARDRLHGPAE